MKRSSKIIPSLQSTAFKPLYSSLAILLALVACLPSFQDHYGNVHVHQGNFHTKIN